MRSRARCCFVASVAFHLKRPFRGDDSEVTTIRFGHFHLHGGLREAYDRIAQEFVKRNPGTRVQQIDKFIDSVEEEMLEAMARDLESYLRDQERNIPRLDTSIAAGRELVSSEAEHQIWRDKVSNSYRNQNQRVMGTPRRKPCSKNKN